MTLAELLTTLERRAADAERMQATAPVAAVIGTVIEELRPLADGRGPTATPTPDRGITAAKAAAILGVSTRFVYEHQVELGGVKLSPRSRKGLRFSEAKVRRLLERRR